MSANLFSVKIEGITNSTTTESLREAFSKFGNVGDVHIPKDSNTREPRGFAFVRFTEQSSLASAIDSMNNRDLDGSTITVTEAGQRRERNSDRGSGKY
jgi:arginine/serine-rich splicing factor 2